MAKCINHLPNIVLLRTEEYQKPAVYKVYGLWPDKGRARLADIQDDKELVTMLKRYVGIADAEFYTIEIEGHFLLKRQHDDNCSARDFGVAGCLSEAERRLEQSARDYVTSWIEGVKQELHEVQTSTGSWHPSVNHPARRSEEYISRLERQVKDFRLRDMIK